MHSIRERRPIRPKLKEINSYSEDEFKNFKVVKLSSRQWAVVTI